MIWAASKLLVVSPRKQQSARPDGRALLVMRGLQVGFAVLDTVQKRLPLTACEDERRSFRVFAVTDSDAIAEVSPLDALTVGVATGALAPYGAGQIQLPRLLLLRRQLPGDGRDQVTGLTST